MNELFFLIELNATNLLFFHQVIVVALLRMNDDYLLIIFLLSNCRAETFISVYSEEIG